MEYEKIRHMVEASERKLKRMEDKVNAGRRSYDDYADDTADGQRLDGALL